MPDFPAGVTRNLLPLVRVVGVLRRVRLAFLGGMTPRTALPAMPIERALSFALALGIPFFPFPGLSRLPTSMGTG